MVRTCKVSRLFPLAKASRIKHQIVRVTVYFERFVVSYFIQRSRSGRISYLPEGKFLFFPPHAVEIVIHTNQRMKFQPRFGSSNIELQRNVGYANFYYTNNRLSEYRVSHYF